MGLNRKAEILQLTIVQVTAGQNVKLTNDTPGNVRGMQLALTRIHPLESSVNGVATELTPKHPVTPKDTPTQESNTK